MFLAQTSLPVRIINVLDSHSILFVEELLVKTYGQLATICRASAGPDTSATLDQATSGQGTAIFETVETAIYSAV